MPGFSPIDPEFEAAAITETLMSPGWKVIEKKIERLIADRYTMLKDGGKENHDRNSGHIDGVKEVLAKTRIWLEEYSKVRMFDGEHSDIS